MVLADDVFESLGAIAAGDDGVGGRGNSRNSRRGVWNSLGRSFNELSRFGRRRVVLNRLGHLSMS